MADKPGKCKLCNCNRTQQEVYDSASQVVSPSGVQAAQAPSGEEGPIIRQDIGLFIISLIMIVGLVISLYYTVYNQYVPLNTTQDVLVAPNNDFTVYVYRPSTFQVPLIGIFQPVVKNITLDISYNRPNLSLAYVQLFTTSDSILTYGDKGGGGKFHAQLYCRPPSNPISSQGYFVVTLDNGTTIKKPCIGTKFGYVDLGLAVSARHTLEVGNTTNPYTVDVTYRNATGYLTHQGVVFSWPIKTLDMNLLSYFWIVLIGVVVSRLYKHYTDQQLTTVGPKRPVGVKDILWMLFSAVIALLIFSTFQEQIHLTAHILINISLAFGFGFGFDKVLEAGQKLDRGQNS